MDALHFCNSPKEVPLYLPPARNRENLGNREHLEKTMKFRVRARSASLGSLDLTPRAYSAALERSRRAERAPSALEIDRSKPLHPRWGANGGKWLLEPALWPQIA